jgi:arylsulfatase A-like enzyme
MKRRLTTAVLLLGAALVACGAPPAPRFTNLVVVVVDTLRSDHLPAYGYGRDTAPGISRLASEGVRLQGYAASSWTKPSVATLFSGLRPQRHQAISLNDQLPEEAPYLPALLAARGFTTLAFIGNAGNIGGKAGFRRGFTDSKQWLGPPKIHGGEVNRQTFEMLPQARPPYFLWVHYVDPHDPYEPPSAWPPGSPPRSYVQPGPFTENGTIPSALELEQMRDQYDGEIFAVDEAISALLAELDRRTLLEDTLVVVTSDHGEEFAEHGQLLHGQSLHEELLRVPLVLWAKSGLPRLESEEPFAHLDFLPTMLDALGVPIPPGLDGASRWAEVGAGKPPPQQAMTFHVDRHAGASLALLDAPYKLIERWGDPDELLYDLSSDPEEGRPLDDPARIDAMRRRIYADHRDALRQALPRSGRKIDPELHAQLQALGYLRAVTGEQALSGRRIPPRLDPSRGLGSQAGPPN